MAEWRALLVLLIATAGARACSGTAADSSKSDQGSAQSRQLLQNQWVWPRESAAIGATRDAIQNLIKAGNKPGDGLKTAARGLEIGRLASNKAVQPWEFDKGAGVGTSGRRMLQHPAATGPGRLQQPELQAAVVHVS